MNNVKHDVLLNTRYIFLLLPSLSSLAFQDDSDAKEAMCDVWCKITHCLQVIFDHHKSFMEKIEVMHVNDMMSCCWHALMHRLQKLHRRLHRQYFIDTTQSEIACYNFTLTISIVWLYDITFLFCLIADRNASSDSAAAPTCSRNFRVLGNHFVLCHWCATRSAARCVRLRCCALHKPLTLHPKSNQNHKAADSH